jgi:Phosphatidylglycerol lysyltransferase, C-terminal
MTTLLSRIPFDTSVFNARISKLNDYWRPSEPTTEPTSDVTTSTSTTAQSEPSLPKSASDVSVGPEPQGLADTEEFDFQQSSSSSQQAADIEADKATGEKEGIAELIAQYGSSSATSWLEFARYKIWRPSVPIPQSSFPPIQGYLRSDPFVFAWGNPIVSDPAALEATCAAFIEWAKSQKLRPIWLCVDGRMEEVLGAQGSKFGWSTLSCIVEDFLDPRSVVELAHSHGGGSEVKDFKKNLRRAERENVQVREVQPDEWTDAMKKQVEEGIAGWKKSKTGIQIASVSQFLCFRLLSASYIFSPS